MNENNPSQKKPEKEQAPKKEKNSLAKKVAEAMVANMQANMQDPNFLDDQERYLQQAAEMVLAKRKERNELKEEEIKKEKREESNNTNTRPPKNT
ncbi:MAG: hypothetical protein E4G98_04115 [Promethearchaeota archaeon]|nr:MAG: hypothetical protein E4G98_04115 [Candidatus Lokiarchaeota archaeon]